MDAGHCTTCLEKIKSNSNNQKLTNEINELDTENNSLKRWSEKLIETLPDMKLNDVLLPETLEEAKIAIKEIDQQLTKTQEVENQLADYWKQINEDLYDEIHQEVENQQETKPKKKSAVR